MIKKYAHRINLWVTRHSVQIAVGIIIFSFGCIILLLAFNQAQNNEQTARETQILLDVKAIAEKINKTTVIRTAQINGIDRHIDCLAAFFALPNRNYKTIQDLNTCTLNTNGN